MITITLYPETMCDLVNELYSRYNMIESDQVINGESKKVPLFKYGGLLVRVINGVPDQMPNAWSFKPTNIEKGSFSTSFLHASVPTNRLCSLSGSITGYIIFPPLKTPKGKVPAEVLCAFASDAHTYFRRNDHGCTHSTPESFDDQTIKSGFCHDQNVKDLEKWKEHTKTNIKKKKDFNPLYVMKCQCAFDMSDADTAFDYFNIVLLANAHLLTFHESMYNELVLKIWDINNPGSMPMQAYFYIIGSPGGQADAKEHQRGYYCATKYIIIPVVGMLLPTKDSGIFFQLEPSTLSHSSCTVQ